jgi:hypothetical protein
MQLSGVLYKSPVADFGQSELALDHSEGVLDLGAYTRFELLDPFAELVGRQIVSACDPRPYRDMPASVSTLSVSNSPMPGIGKDISFLSMQQGLGLSEVMHMGSGAGKAMHQTRLGIYFNTGLHTKFTPLFRMG